MNTVLKPWAEKKFGGNWRLYMDNLVDPTIPLDEGGLLLIARMFNIHIGVVFKNDTWTTRDEMGHKEQNWLAYLGGTFYSLTEKGKGESNFLETELSKNQGRQTKNSSKTLVESKPVASTPTLRTRRNYRQDSPLTSLGNARGKRKKQVQKTDLLAVRVEGLKKVTKLPNKKKKIQTKSSEKAITELKVKGLKKVTSVTQLPANVKPNGKRATSYYNLRTSTMAKRKYEG